MALPPEDRRAQHSSPPAATSGADRFVVVAAAPERRRNALFAFLALALGAATATAWLATRSRFAHPTSGDAAATNAQAARAAENPLPSAEPQDTAAGIAPAPISRTPPGMVDCSALRGNGVTAAEFIALVRQAAGAPDAGATDKAAAGLLSLRLSGYEGDRLITAADAEGMLVYLGLTAGRDRGARDSGVQPLGSHERLWHLLAANADPDGPDWGALRPWRSVTISSGRSVGALLAECRAAPGAASLYALARALPGGSRVVSVSDDGRVTQRFVGPPSATELHAAETLFVESARAADSGVRTAAAAGLGELLGLNSQAQLPADSGLVTALGALLKDKDAEVAGAAALAAGKSASVSTIGLLASCLLEWRGTKPAELAAALAALTHAESLGRRLDAQALGAEQWERRRMLYQTVSSWLASTANEQKTDAANLGLAVAWLRAVEVFRGNNAFENCARTLGNQVWQTGDARAQFVVLSLARTDERFAAANLPAALRLGVVAGPLWWRSSLTLEQATALLDAGDTRSLLAALWRLARGEGRAAELGWPAAARPELGNRIEAVARNSQSAAQRRLALEALYRDRRRKTADGATETFRLCWDAAPALQAFLDDPDTGVQTAAAGIVGRLGGSADVFRITRANLAGRAPEAVARMSTALAARWQTGGNQAAELTPAVVAWCDLNLGSENEAVARQAGVLRLSDPELDVEAKVRLLHSFRAPAARAGGIMALSCSGKKDSLPARLALYLLGDSSALARGAVFESRLPRLVAASERGRVLLKGLDDSDATVRVACVGALEPPVADEVALRVREMAASDPGPDVRALAAQALRSIPDRHK